MVDWWHHCPRFLFLQHHHHHHDDGHHYNHKDPARGWGHKNRDFNLNEAKRNGEDRLLNHSNWTNRFKSQTFHCPLGVYWILFQWFVPIWLVNNKRKPALNTGTELGTLDFNLHSYIEYNIIDSEQMTRDYTNECMLVGNTCTFQW